MDARVQKLTQALRTDADTAAKLVEAGVFTENRAKQMSLGRLAKIVGMAEAKRIRGE